MPQDCIPYQKSAYFSSLIQDYLDKKESLKFLYNRFPNIENFEAQILEKQQQFDNNIRESLIKVLKNQYVGFKISKKTAQNIEALQDQNTFTITTGHQLNLFTGPLYFLYKIVNTIKLAQELNTKYPNQNFVPIYWMATEDHDFEEINHLNLNGKKFRWDKKTAGAVGRINPADLNAFFELFATELGNNQNAEQLKKWFKSASFEQPNLAQATRYLVNEIFGNHGLVILDADNAVLKNHFAPYIKTELLEKRSEKAVLETIKSLKEYNIQVNPRNINLFYLDDQIRERIVFENDLYKVNNTTLQFTETEILALLTSNPEKFSPNVILRPLYQEVILPNLCYIGGGGEIAYWLELKKMFEDNQVVFPMLLIRNAAVIATQKQVEKMRKLDLSWTDLFSKQNELIANRTKALSPFHLDLNVQKEQLKQQFQALFELAKQTDKSFTGAVKAQEVKQTKGLENLEKRLIRAQKRKLTDVLTRITILQNELFPNQSLQERQINFTAFYLLYGNDFIDAIITKLEPLSGCFAIIEL